MFTIYIIIIIYIVLIVATIAIASYALKYHNEFNKLQESVDISKNMISRIIEDKESEDKLDTSVKGLTDFMNNLKAEYENKLKEAENNLNLIKNIFESTDSGIALVTEKKGDFVLCNRAFKYLTGYGEKQLKKKNIISIIDEYKIRKNKEIKTMAQLLQNRELLMSDKYERIISLKVLYSSKEYEEENLLTIIMEDVTENIKLREDINLQNKKLSIINTIAKEVNQSLELKKILQDTLNKILDFVKADSGLIMLMNNEEQSLRPVAFSGISSALIKDLKNTYIKSDRGTRGEVLSMGQPVIARDIPNNSSFTEMLFKKGSFKSVAMVPLKSENKVVGLMQIGSFLEKKFSQEDLNLLYIIGNYIGIAINNSNLYGTIKNQLGELEKKNLRLTELEQLKTSLIQMIVHDLKNPLLGIMGYTDLLLEDEEIYDEIQLKALKMIYIGSKDLMRMILNLLDISRMEEQRVTLRLEEIILKDLINKNISEVRPILLKENKTASINIPENLPIIKVDKDLIQRVIANLLNNAIKYSPPSGNIEIGVNYGASDRWLTVYIADEGEGIPKDYQDKIFEKFIQLRAQSQNMPVFRTSRGLGLTFCKLAVEAHGGRIWVESDVGRGSKFCFNLPFIHFPDEETL